MKQSIKEISIQKNIPYSDILWEFITHDFLWRLYKSNFTEIVWLSDAMYASGKRLELYYIYTKAENVEIEIKKIKEALFLDEKLNEHSQVVWNSDGLVDMWSFNVICDNTTVFYPIHIKKLKKENAGIPAQREIQLLNHKQKQIVLNTFSPELILGENMLEIVEKLELINSMKSYEKVYDILKNSSISGRHILEILNQQVEKEPRLAVMRRLEQLKEYRGYSYMKKRWNQHCKRVKRQEQWEEVVDLILAFIEPLWSALCQNEIFFDDWMPELGRFLG